MYFENPLLAKKSPLLDTIIKKTFCMSVNILNELQIYYINTF